tara:strand:- start:723 stop:974 length:252 start_codon:yes stop_codon:yes gene_type:complete
MSETQEKSPPIRTGDPRLTKKEPELLSVAFGVSQDKDGRWQTVEVAYNAITGDAKVKTYHTNESKGSAVERFKILVGQSNILD